MSSDVPSPIMSYLLPWRLDPRVSVLNLRKNSTVFLRGSRFLFTKFIITGGGAVYLCDDVCLFVQLLFLCNFRKPHMCPDRISPTRVSKDSFAFLSRHGVAPKGNRVKHITCRKHRICGLTADVEQKDMYMFLTV